MDIERGSDGTQKDEEGWLLVGRDPCCPPSSYGNPVVGSYAASLVLPTSATFIYLPYDIWWQKILATSAMQRTRTTSNSSFVRTSELGGSANISDN